MASPIIPNLDNSLTGYAFNTVTTPINYYNTDFNFPLAEFTAKLDDEVLFKLISVMNKLYQTTFTLDGYKNTGPLGDCLKMYNYVKLIPGYKRLLYNYALPLINLAILMQKVDTKAITNPNSLQTLYPVDDSLYTFMHMAIEKLFNIIVSEGRTYNELSLQMFGSTHNDGLDTENKLSRIIKFWSSFFDKTVEDRTIFNRIYQTYVTNNNFFLKYKMDITNTNSQLTRQSVNLLTYADIINYFEEFTRPSLNIDPQTNQINSINLTASNIDIINTLKLIQPGYYDNTTNESTLVPVNPVIYKNAYSLNPTFSYSDFKTSSPTQAVTYGDYLLLLLYRLYPAGFTNYITASNTATKFLYSDIANIVNVLKLSVIGNSILPNLTGYDTTTLFGAPVFNKSVDNIFIDIKDKYDDDFIPCLLELFDYIPKSSTLSFSNVGTSVSVADIVNFYNPEAVADLFNNGTLRHSLFRNKSFSYNMSFPNVKTNTSNQIIGLVIFSLLAQQYSNKNLSIFDNTEYKREPFDANGSSYFTVTGNLLTMIKATLILMDRVYCYFIKAFGRDNMILFSGSFLENSGLDVSIIRTLLGIGALSDQTFDPIDYMGYLSFSYLTIYNNDFVRELTQDLICNYVVSMINTDAPTPENALQARINDLERKLNYLMNGANGFQANNSFKAYSHTTLSSQI